MATHLGAGFSAAQLWTLVREAGMTDDEAAHFSASAGAPISSDAPEAGEQAAARLGGLLHRWHAFVSEGCFAESAAPGQPANRAGTPVPPGAASSRGRSQSRNRGRPAAAATAQGRRSPHSPPPASAAADDGFGSGSDVDAASEDGVAATASGGTPSYNFKYGPAESPEDDLVEFSNRRAANECCLC